MKKLTLFSLLLILLFLNFANAQERERPFRPGKGVRRGNENSERVSAIRTGQVSFGGNGCPDGSMRAVFAPDNLSFTLLYDNFVATVDPATLGKRDVMTCDVLIPIEIPMGMQMEITRIDFRGFVALPDKVKAQLQTVFNFRGRGGDGQRLSLINRFQGPVMDNYEITADAVSESSPCGGSTTLRATTQLKVISQNKAETSTITLDSIDGSSNAVYFVNWKKCQGLKNPNRPERPFQRQR